ncbi:hypothetical protein NLJ89_g8429 [Agrocybe chaxingu]|uniref:DUF6534 domain-containing protein n=1 Tax=Agrocybe chaxingu TaxID=84603 RepID=A0A9W8JUG0_9AGAR|nr:hypothetical protein NLJ89_g8429 [Agrocybe chaxingu]
MSSPSPVHIKDTFGAIFIGALVTMTIYGITTLQAYFYYLSFPQDGIKTKLLVASIWVLDTMHAIFMCHALHHYLIDQFGNAAALRDGTWTVFSSIAINVIMAFIVQWYASCLLECALSDPHSISFFTQRIFKLSPLDRRWWIAGVIGFFVFAHFVFGIQTVVYLFIKKQFARLKEVALTSALPFGVSAIISDITIAAALCMLLRNSRTTFEDTNTVINRLIIFAINRCILTSAMAILETIVFTILPNSFYSLAIDFVIGKLYANSLLAVLNSRARLRSGTTQEESSATEMSLRFNVTSAVANHQTSLLQVRTRDRDRSNIADEEKGDQRIVTVSTTASNHSRKDGRTLDEGLAL